MGREQTKKADGSAVHWLARGVLLLLLWWLLVEGRIDGLWFAAPVILAAYLARKALPIPLARTRIHPIKALLFLPWFVRSSVAAGWDVAWRALSPGLPIRPFFATYPLRVRSTSARVFLSQAISLMPGTLTCVAKEESLVVHALCGTEENIVADTAKLEARVAAIYGEDIAGTDP